MLLSAAAAAAVMLAINRLGLGLGYFIAGALAAGLTYLVLSLFTLKLAPNEIGAAEAFADKLPKPASAIARSLLGRMAR
jgi:hypothetical protein